MGLASGGGGGGGGGTFIYFGGRSNDDDPVAAMVAVGVGLLLVGGIITYVVINNNHIKEERQELQTQLAEDAGVKDFRLEYFDWLTENNEYFFTFSGSAMKMDGKPLDFILTKYNVSEKNYYELVTYIEKNNIEGLDEQRGLFPRILEIVQESELVANSNVEKLTNAVYDKDNGDMVAIKNVKMPVVDKKTNTVSYLVQLAKYNKTETENTNIEFITKRITVPLTKQLEEMPSLAYFAKKEEATVKTVKSVKVPVQDFDYLVFDGKKAQSPEMNF